MFNFKDWVDRIPLMRYPGFGKVLILLGSGIFMMVLASAWVNPKPQSTQQAVSRQQVVATDSADLSPAEKELEGRLERILSAVSGVGSVQVTVTLATGPQHVYARNTSKQDRTIDEKDQTGGSRTTTDINEQNNLVFGQATGGVKEDPVMVQETKPEISGVLVLAEGARNPVLREKLVHAVETVLDLPPYKVIVLVKEGR